ncbi:MAG: SET domain-containing protein-lysine N-methyltransferase [Ferruginibacter sp.]
MTTETHSKNASDILSRHGFADVWFNSISRHHSLYATTAFNTGDMIAKFYAATTQNYPTYLTVQTGRDTHIILEPVFLQYINHSCDPNVFFDTTAMQVICIKPIHPGDELGFFYPSAEWEMAQPFVCNCGSKNCLQLINGAAHLSEETISRYRLTDFILQKIKQKNTA